MTSRLWRATGPAETRFFLFVGGFGLALAAIYWVVSAELAGTVLLGGFGLGAGLLGVRLRVERPVASARGRDPRPADGNDEVDGDGDGDRGDEVGGEPAVPFRDDTGRLPGETLAPLALALGVALALTALVFGVWLLVAGIVPLAWGSWTWLRGSRDELAATVAAEARAGRD